eukprot:13226645-Alexandrium_andersonii.AAC.1
MSASLVGSEMCIRDRTQCVLMCPQRHALESLDVGGPGDELAMPRSSETVSYTHLTLPTICSV